MTRIPLSSSLERVVMQSGDFTLRCLTSSLAQTFIARFTTLQYRAFLTWPILDSRVNCGQILQEVNGEGWRGVDSCNWSAHKLRGQDTL